MIYPVTLSFFFFFLFFDVEVIPDGDIKWLNQKKCRKTIRSLKFNTNGKKIFKRSKKTKA